MVMEAHEEGADGQADHDDDHVFGDGKGADHTVKAKGGVEGLLSIKTADAAFEDNLAGVANLFFGFQQTA